MTASSTRLGLVRHGQTTWNAAGLWQGHADPPLTELGRAQARRLARRLVEGADCDFERIVSSDLDRARETARILADALGLPSHEDDRLRELDVGDWSGRTRAEIEAIAPAALRAFEAGDPESRPGNGESRIALRERAQSFLRDWVARRPGEPFLLVAHLGVIRVLAPGAEPANGELVETSAEVAMRVGDDAVLRAPASTRGRVL